MMEKVPFPDRVLPTLLKISVLKDFVETFLVKCLLGVVRMSIFKLMLWKFQVDAETCLEMTIF